MKYFVVEPLTVETQQGCVTLPAGKVLELNRNQAAKILRKIEMIPPTNGGRDLPHHCLFYGGWCSEKLHSSTYPSGCVRNACDHYHASQDATQTINEQQGKLAPAP
ncbi:MAG: hypothetical protein PHI31_06760 [Desulfuromonadaceae bacterium]|nr:hypothetical protein [Desulfuromonadaceae bacterium]